jgi:ketosteroid isomerase-like protein
MTDDNVRIVRQLLAAWEVRDDEAGRALLDPEIEWHPAADEPETETLHGIAEVERLLDQWVESFDDLRVEPREFIAANDCVVVPLRVTGRLRGSDSEVAIEETHVYRVRDGRIAEVWDFRTTEEAMAAAGIPAPG